MESRDSLCRDIWIKLKNPIGLFPFWVSLITVILGSGGISVWVELVEYLHRADSNASSDNLRVAVITYFPAVGCSAAHQLFIRETKKDLQSLGWLVAFFLPACCVVALRFQDRYPKALVSKVCARPTPALRESPFRSRPFSV
jgi:hypothetical protein